MATAGWYPDPSGQPGAFRFWDGDQWSETVADTPYGPPPGGAPGPLPPPPPAPTAPIATAPAPHPPSQPPPPTPPAGFDQPTIVPGTGSTSGYESYAAVGPLGPPATYGRGSAVPPPPPGSPGNGTGRTLGLALVAVLVTLTLGIVTFFVVRTLIDDDDSTVTTTTAPRPDPTTEAAPTPEPTPEPTPDATPEPTPDASPTDPAQPTLEQCTAGLPANGITGQQGRKMTGGGLSLRQPKGYDGTLGDQAGAFTFADGVYAPSMVIEQNPSGTSSWVAVYALGSLNRANGFESPQQAAEVVLDCMIGSPTFYSDVTGSAELASTDTVVDGDPAWELTEEIRVDNPQLTVEGDVAKVVVVDTGDPEAYALFVSVVPIGDQDMIDQQSDAVGELTLQ